MATSQADCASFFMAVAEDTSADMTQEVPRVLGVTSVAALVA